MAVQIKLDDKVLQQMIQQVGDTRVQVYAIADGVEYGLYQEFTDRGHPSLVPAFERNTGQLPDAVGQAIEKNVSLDDVLKKVAFDIQREWAADVNVDTGAYKNSIHVEES